MNTIGSLFSGIGGLELGLERAGIGKVLWQCESDEFCRTILAKHWPESIIFDDVRELDENTPKVDVLCGGFPCQDLSIAGKGEGLNGSKSKLWEEFIRIIRILRPSIVFVENVPALLGRGFGRILGDLASLGYDCFWQCLSASTIGAPHKRERLFLVAYSPGEWRLPSKNEIQTRGIRSFVCDWWKSEPDLARVADGIPDQVDRLRTLGNAVVPQVAEAIGRIIVRKPPPP